MQLMQSIPKSRSARLFCLLLIPMSLFLTRPSSGATILGEVVCDNVHAVYTGNASGSSLTLHGGGNSWNIAESYSITTTDSHLYIATWSDDAVQQGLLHDLSIDGVDHWSQHPSWQVYATGDDLDAPFPGGAPSLAQLGAHIATANTGSLWVATTVGGANDGSFLWPAAAGIATTAQWVWYESGTGPSNPYSPFYPGWNHHEFLIFRLPLEAPTSVETASWGRIKALMR